jgi:hypothetical protein
VRALVSTSVRKGLWEPASRFEGVLGALRPPISSAYPHTNRFCKGGVSAYAARMGCASVFAKDWRASRACLSRCPPAALAAIAAWLLTGQASLWNLSPSAVTPWPGLHLSPHLLQRCKLMFPLCRIQWKIQPFKRLCVGGRAIPSLWMSLCKFSGRSEEGLLPVVPTADWQRPCGSSKTSRWGCDQS